MGKLLVVLFIIFVDVLICATFNETRAREDQVCSVCYECRKYRDLSMNVKTEVESVLCSPGYIAKAKKIRTYAEDSPYEFTSRNHVADIPTYPEGSSGNTVCYDSDNHFGNDMSLSFSFNCFTPCTVWWLIETECVPPQWRSDAWSTCSSDCTQTCNIWCVDANGATIGNVYCLSATGMTPPTSQSCGGGSCAISWDVGAWSFCMSDCKKRRSVICKSSAGETLPDSDCTQQKPIIIDECEGDVCSGGGIDRDSLVEYADEYWDCTDMYCTEARVIAGSPQRNFMCAEFVSRALVAAGYITGLDIFSPGSAYDNYEYMGIKYAMRYVSSKQHGPLGLEDYLIARGWKTSKNADANIHAGTVMITPGDDSIYGHVVIGVGENLINAHNNARYHVNRNFYKVTLIYNQPQQGGDGSEPNEARIVSISCGTLVLAVVLLVL